MEQPGKGRLPKLDQASEAQLPSKNSTSIGFDAKRKVDFSDVDELIGEEFLTAVATKKVTNRSPPRIRKQQLKTSPEPPANKFVGRKKSTTQEDWH